MRNDFNSKKERDRESENVRVKWQRIENELNLTCFIAFDCYIALCVSLFIVVSFARVCLRVLEKFTVSVEYRLKRARNENAIFEDPLEILLKWIKVMYKFRNNFDFDG